MKSAKICTNDFNRLISATKNFTGARLADSCHHFIKLEFHAEESQVTAAALDGYRLSVEHSVISDCNEDFVAFVKSNIRLPSGKYASISLEDDGKEAVIRCDGFSFGYTQPQDDNFDWQRAIPTSEVKYKIAFNGNYLLSALQAAKVSLGNSFKEPVVLEFRSEREPVVLRTNKHDIKMVLPVLIREG